MLMVHTCNNTCFSIVYDTVQTVGNIRKLFKCKLFCSGITRNTCIGAYLRNLSLAFPHGRNYYVVWPFLVCLSYDPDNIDGLDVKAVKRIINRVKELYPDADEAEIIKLIGKKPK